MFVYIVNSCANEFDDLGYDRPYPVFYSLSEKRAKKYFKKEKEKYANTLSNLLEQHPEFKDNEDYQINKDTENYFKIYMGKWFYQLELNKVVLQ